MEAAKKRVELEDKLKALEEEKTNLSAEVEALKVIPQLQARVSTLESEVGKLRDERKRLQAYAKFTSE